MCSSALQRPLWPVRGHTKQPHCVALSAATGPKLLEFHLMDLKRPTLERSSWRLHRSAATESAALLAFLPQFGAMFPKIFQKCLPVHFHSNDCLVKWGKPVDRVKKVSEQLHQSWMIRIWFWWKSETDSNILATNTSIIITKVVAPSRGFIATDFLFLPRKTFRSRCGPDIDKMTVISWNFLEIFILEIISFSHWNLNKKTMEIAGHNSSVFFSG